MSVAGFYPSKRLVNLLSRYFDQNKIIGSIKDIDFVMTPSKISGKLWKEFYTINANVVDKLSGKLKAKQ